MDGLGIFVTKDEYADTLRAYQKLSDEMKSQRKPRKWVLILIPGIGLSTIERLNLT